MTEEQLEKAKKLKEDLKFLEAKREDLVKDEVVGLMLENRCNIKFSESFKQRAEDFKTLFLADLDSRINELKTEFEKL